MTPTLKEGDLIIYKPFKYSEDILLEGLLVVLEHPLKTGVLIVKRIYKIDSGKLEILGDNKSSSTDSRQFGQIRKEQIQGIVEKIIPRRV
ncbi:Signal peptidase I [Prochlorococcus sp. MIT 0602]|nr:Signal peptidase I [Prochlorococcus sp. MIT 0603]KGG17993.1 Signal peptidase I [Prochlorococcus sp. MIT 0602]